MSRSEEQKISQEPISAKVGGKDYSIPLLKIKQSREWKKKWWDAINGSDGYRDSMLKIDTIRKGSASTEEVVDALSKGFHMLLIDQSNAVIDLVADYVEQAKCGLTRDIIEEEGTEADIAILWEQINEVAFPLVTSLATAMTRNR